MDVPIALALGAGVVQGTVNVVRDSGPAYFDAVSTLILLLLVGRYLQYRAQRTASDAAALLGALSPATARVVDALSGAIDEVPSEAVMPGMELDLRAGDTLAAGGGIGRTEPARSSARRRLRVVLAHRPVRRPHDTGDAETPRGLVAARSAFRITATSIAS